MKRFTKLFVFLSVCALAVPTFAAPEPVAPGYLSASNPLNPIGAGQTTFASFGNYIDPNLPDDFLQVDWMVLEIVPNRAYLYLYQLENTSTYLQSNNQPASLVTFSVSLPTGTGVVGAAGVFAGSDLDLAGIVNVPFYGLTNYPAHDVSNFAILAGESDPHPTNSWSSNALTTISATTVSWTSPGNLLAPNAQSEILYILASTPPVVGTGSAQDTNPPSPWGNVTTPPGVSPTGADYIPVPGFGPPFSPVPEPASLTIWALFGLCVGGFGIRRCRA